MMIKKLRKRIIDLTYKAQEGHIPSALSVLDILWVLYDKVMNVFPDDPHNEDRDRFVLSKGHASLALYAILEEKGFIKKITDFARYDSNYGGHPDMNKINGVEASTGSLGHGLPMAVGVAMGLRMKDNKRRVFVLVGDGECNEGSIWEAAMLAAHHNLTNLTCIVDYNRSTDRALMIDDLGAKFKAFGWCVHHIDGHDHKQIEQMLRTPSWEKPTCVICDTIKGKGVGRMENNPEWHHKSPNKEEYEEIIKEICE
jgi:transketolase